MPKFISRFLEIRGVVKDVYMQIHVLYDFNHERSRSLGRHPVETYGEWKHRSPDPFTWTWGYEPNDYIAEVKGIVKMDYEVERVLRHIQEIYNDLPSIIHCDTASYDDLNTPYDPRKDILEVLNPKVDLNIIEKKMAYDPRLKSIEDRIFKVI